MAEENPDQESNKRGYRAALEATMTRLSEVVRTTPPELIGNIQSFEAGWMAACRYMEMNMVRVTSTMGRPRLERPSRPDAPVVTRKTKL